MNNKATTEVLQHNLQSNSYPIKSKKVNTVSASGYIKAFSQPSIERLRIILMFFMCIDLFGFSPLFGNLLQKICGFVPIAFYILSGYLVLQEREDRSARIVRSIKRSAIAFGATTLVYFGINFLYKYLCGGNILPTLLKKRFWFNFIVLNVWKLDIGNAIWYVQALLYAYIIIYFLDKWKLLRFDWIVSLILIIFTVITGELSGLIRWEFLGYNYLAGNFLTRALPYILLGSFISRKKDVFLKLKLGTMLFGVLAGIMLILGEMVLLDKLKVPGYYGHLIGMPVVAVSVCLIAFKDKTVVPGPEWKLHFKRWHINSIYYLCQPVSTLLIVLLSLASPLVAIRLLGFIGIITFAVCFIIACLLSLVDRKLSKKNEKEQVTTIKLAGIAVEIHHRLNSLTGIEAYQTEETPVFSVSVNEDDIFSEQRRLKAEAAQNDEEYPLLTLEELESAAIFRKVASRLPDFNAFIFCGPAVAVDGKAYVFIKKGEADTQEHARLWLKNIGGCSFVDIENPIFRMIDKKPYVYGCPWTKEAGDGYDMAVPVHAVALLTNSESNSIKEVKIQYVVPHLAEQTYRPQDDVVPALTERLCKEVAKRVGLYAMTCNGEDEAARVAFGEMSREN